MDMQKAGNADVIFSIKPILFELSDKMAGSRVLDGSPGTVPQAMAMPKGRDAGLPYARKFIDDANRKASSKPQWKERACAASLFGRPSTFALTQAGSKEPLSASF
jgi:hypothetical protein